MAAEWRCGVEGLFVRTVRLVAGGWTGMGQGRCPPVRSARFDNPGLQTAERLRPDNRLRGHDEGSEAAGIRAALVRGWCGGRRTATPALQTERGKGS